MKIKKTTKYSLFVLLSCLIFFFIYSFTSLTVWWPYSQSIGHLIFNWPDANANYFFSQLFARASTLSFAEPLNLIMDNILHTRSINVINGNLVPMTFLWALIIFGSIIKFAGLFILFLTPLLAAATVFILYKLFYLLFKDLNLSLLIVGLLLPLAPWLFFANVVMLPTILFIFLLSSGLLCFIISQKYSARHLFILGSILVVLSIMVRPTEIIWIVVALGLLYYFSSKKITKQNIGIFCGILILFSFFTLLFNKFIYGGWFSFGYLNLQNNALPTEFVDDKQGFLVWLKLLFAPFGWQTKVFLANIWYYLIKIIWPYWLLAILSIILLRKKIINYKSIWFQYLLFTVLVSLLILIYYANWNLADDMVKQYNKISISYVRYFLPIYILSLPFVAQAIKFLTGFKNKYFKNLLRVFFIMILAIFSLKLAFYAPHDGLLATKQTLIGYYDQFDQVRELAPQNSVIITERSDKVFFPYYRVIVMEENVLIWPLVENIVETTEVFYYTSKSEEQIEAMHIHFQLNNLELIEIKQVNSQFKLFQVKFLDQFDSRIELG